MSFTLDIKRCQGYYIIKSFTKNKLQTYVCNKLLK